MLALEEFRGAVSRCIFPGMMHEPNVGASREAAANGG